MPKIVQQFGMSNCCWTLFLNFKQVRLLLKFSKPQVYALTNSNYVFSGDRKKAFLSIRHAISFMQARTGVKIYRSEQNQNTKTNQSDRSRARQRENSSKPDSRPRALPDAALTRPYSRLWFCTTEKRAYAFQKQIPPIDKPFPDPSHFWWSNWLSHLRPAAWSRRTAKIGPTSSSSVDPLRAIEPGPFAEAQTFGTKTTKSDPTKKNFGSVRRLRLANFFIMGVFPDVDHESEAKKCNGDRPDLGNQENRICAVKKLSAKLLW